MPPSLWSKLAAGRDLISFNLIKIMFSYRIHNPNNAEIQSDSTVIPFGHRCSSALACKYANLRKCSLPFDWTRTCFPGKIQKVLEHNFHEFIPDVQKGVFRNKYEFDLAHFNSNRTQGVEEYKRRIARFNELITQPKKKYFVFINEDYLYDPKYRETEFVDTLFHEMVNLERFLREKYPEINYTIIYIDFKQHTIPSDSCILNAVLQSARFFNAHDSAPVEPFRNFCGTMLAELFKTPLSLGYNTSVFYN